MEAIRIKAVAQHGKLSVDVPEEYNNRELEVVILVEPNVANENRKTTNKKRRLAIVGKAPEPHFPITKYDAYNQ